MFTRFKTSRGVVLRKIDGRLSAAFQLAGGLVPAPSGAALPLAIPFAGILTALVALGVLIAVALLLAAIVGDVGAALAFPAAVATPRPLKDLLTELKKIQEDHRGKPMPDDVGKKFEELAAEAKVLQDEAEREERVKGIERFANETPGAALPAGPRADKGAGAQAAGIVGYLSVGEAYVKSAEFKAFADRGFPKEAQSAHFQTDIKREGDELLIPVTREMIERKAVDPTGLITPDRVNRLIEAARSRRPFLRDVIEVLSTNSSSIEYPIINQHTDASAGVLPGGVKPEANIVTTSGNTPVRDLAVTTPIKEQTLQDVPQIMGIIDGRLRNDLRRTEEREMLWGDGTTLLGLFNTPGVGEMVRVRANATLLDKIRMGVTDIQLAQGDPNFISADPLDVEELQLLKGTDSHYIWTIVTDPATGQLRVWGLTMIPTVAMRKPGTTERRLLIGDGMGATLWDRNQIQAAIGWVNDQFRRNERTVRLEERVAFAAWMPYLFRYLVTQAAA